MLSTDKVYIVWGQTETHNYFVALATGDPYDIKQFYFDKCGYGPHLQEVTINHIEGEDIKRRKELEFKKGNLQREIDSINRELGHI